MLLKKNNLIFALLLLLVLLASYTKETLFEIINALLAGKEHNYANTSPPKFLLQASAQELIRYKWIILAVNILFINIANVVFLLISKQKQLLKFYGVILLFLLLTAFLFLSGYAFLKHPVLKELARTIQDILESPFLLILLYFFIQFPHLFQKKAT